MMVFWGIFLKNTMIFIARMYLDGVGLAIITISSSTFHPLLLMVFINGWYFLVFVVIVSKENLSLQFVNSMNCILRLFSRAIGGFDWYGNPLIHIMPDLNLAL